MGTNYYLRRKIPNTKLKKVRELVTEETIYNGGLQEVLNQFKKVHIGTSYCGWQFLFNHNNGKYYQKTKDSIDSFLRKEVKKGGKLINEYGDEQDIDDFWNMVQSKKDDFTQASYYKYECERWYDYQVHPEHYEQDILKPFQPTDWSTSHPETFSEDEWHLRFSDSTEFS